jgi:hypothetical protein
VVVTINHSLNLFGHSYLGEHLHDHDGSGNTGLLDVVSALRWVRANIAKFGGDPGMRDHLRPVRRWWRTGARPAALIGQDKAAMLGLPPVSPVTGFATRVRLRRDYYVRMGSNDYSVHPQAIGRFVDVIAALETVTVSPDGRCVGTHTKSWGAGLTLTDPEHVEAAQTMRKAFQNPAPPGDTAGLRDLADYDGRSVSSLMTGRSRDGRSEGNRRTDRVLLPGHEGATDSGSSSQARGEGPRQRLDP